ncbi:hypothetical protein KIH27_20260 [Mycobacterium sp. M1]|uniref:Peptidase S1 domain-containing protein n=2 Tax=Mycolicibacter acidiphilus TaxID=2835306 RepID=A0ABS5RNN1_9MYCO|nr:hypothetical protein [Mycolicibacter acidiphilus]
MRRLAIVTMTTALCIAFAPMPAAKAANMTVGMRLQFEGHSCSLGFFGFDAHKDRLAVTSGHCAHRLNEPVYNDSHVQLGEVVSLQRDVKDSNGNLTGSRGYTIIFIYGRFSIEPFFARSGSISVDDSVSKFGGRTGMTHGHITRIQDNSDRPDLALMSSDMVQLPGDSGSPWYTSGPTLVGIASSGNQEREGGGAGSQAQPISDVLKMIRTVARYGDGFHVWTQ